MAEYFIKSETLTEIANAIREKNKSFDLIKVSNMAAQIGAITAKGETAVSVDFSQYDEGVITETYADGTTKTYSFEFDENGNVSKVTEGDSKVYYSFEFDDEGNLVNISDSEGNSTAIVGSMPFGGAGADGVETYVTLDFSGGDMEVAPNEGEAFSKVTIPQPENLIPENIAEGVDIAGIIGTLAASGGGAKVALGTFTGVKQTEMVITHGLEIVPDIVYIGTPKRNETSTTCIANCIGFSRKFIEKNGLDLAGIRTCQYKANLNYSVVFDKTSVAIDEQKGSLINTCIFGANESTFSIIDIYSLQEGSIYYWIAIGGLT